VEKERVKLLKIQEAEAAGKLSTKKAGPQDSSDSEMVTPEAEKAAQ